MQRVHRVERLAQKRRSLLRRRRGSGALCLAELRAQFFESREVRLQPRLRIFIGVIENAGRPLPATVADEAQESEVLGPLPQHEDLFSRLVTAWLGAIQVQGEQVRL